MHIIGVDEHKWKHTHAPGSPPDFVTVIVDITPTVAGTTGASRLLDVLPGRSTQALTLWLKNQPDWFRQHITVVTMDGFTGYATAID